MEFARGLPRRIERELNSRDPMSFIVLHEEIVNRGNVERNHIYFAVKFFVYSCRDRLDVTLWPLRQQIKEGGFGSTEICSKPIGEVL